MFSWHAPGVVWVEHTAENAAVAAAAMALSLMTPGGVGSTPWQTVVMMSAKAALYVMLYAVVGLPQANRTASLNPHVVATAKRRRRPASAPQVATPDETT